MNNFWIKLSKVLSELNLEFSHACKDLSCNKAKLSHFKIKTKFSREISCVDVSAVSRLILHPHKFYIKRVSCMYVWICFWLYVVHVLLSSRCRDFIERNFSIHMKNWTEQKDIHNGINKMLGIFGVFLSIDIYLNTWALLIVLIPHSLEYIPKGFTDAL